MAYKGNDHKVGRNGAIGGYRVELAGLVENNAPFFQGVACLLYTSDAADD